MQSQDLVAECHPQFLHMVKDVKESLPVGSLHRPTRLVQKLSSGAAVDPELEVPHGGPQSQKVDSLPPLLSGTGQGCL